MKKQILTTFFLMPFILFCQTNNHIFFGVNLDSDWYSLTNQSRFAYVLEESDSNYNYVAATCKNIKDKIDPKLINIGFEDMSLNFPKGFKGDFKTLKPIIFKADIFYNTPSDYKFKSENDVLMILNLIKNKYGDAELNLIKDKFSVYKWSSQYHEIILTCREDELYTRLIYIKKN